MRKIFINRERLNEAIVDAGYSLSGLSVFLGRGTDYIGSSIRKGYIESDFYEEMCEELNLNPNDYVEKKQKRNKIKRDTALIDGKKFEQDLRKKLPKGVNFSAIGKGLKMSESWLSACIARERIGKEFLESICLFYGLNAEKYIARDIAKDEESSKEEKPERNIAEPDAYDLLLMIDELNRKINDLQSKGDVA